MKRARSLHPWLAVFALALVLVLNARDVGAWGGGSPTWIGSGGVPATATNGALLIGNASGQWVAFAPSTQGNLIFSTTGGAWAQGTQALVIGEGQYFGDCSDGNATADGSTTLTCLGAPSSSTYTQGRVCKFNNLTVNSGVTIKAGAFYLLVCGTLTLNGTYSNNGANGAGQSGTGTGALWNAVGGGSDGGNGGNAGVTGSNAFSFAAGAGGGTPGGTTSSSNAAKGALGGTGNTGTVAGGTAGTIGAPFTLPTAPFALFQALTQGVTVLPSGATNGAFTLMVGGGTGGGGGGGGSGVGGGGGGGAGVVLIGVNTLTGNGAINAIGGNGAAGAGTGGGGSGGGGGLIEVIYGTKTGWTGTTSVAGGSLGAGGSSGTAGSAGTVTFTQG